MRELPGLYIYEKYLKDIIAGKITEKTDKNEYYYIEIYGTIFSIDIFYSCKQQVGHACRRAINLWKEVSKCRSLWQVFWALCWQLILL